MSEIIESTDHIEPETDVPALINADKEVMAPDAMDNLIKAGEKIQAFDKAFSAILNVVMKRTYAGDWVSHSKSSDPQHLRFASLSGAGCDRVATILGISEHNWKEHKKQMSDDGKFYTFRYEADFTWGGLTRHAFGECSTRNKFFSYANGAYKEITDIREDHVRKAAQRECQKDGIRRLLGLRKVPINKLKELGFDVNLVHFVNFNSAKDAIGTLPPPVQAATGGKAPDKTSGVSKVTNGGEMSFGLKSVKGREWNGKKIIDIVSDTGVKMSWWDKDISGPEMVQLLEAQKSDALVTIEYMKNGEYYNVAKIIEVTPR